MKKLSNTETELKKGVASQKKCVVLQGKFSCVRGNSFEYFYLLHETSLYFVKLNQKFLSNISEKIFLKFWLLIHNLFSRRENGFSLNIIKHYQKDDLFSKANQSFYFEQKISSTNANVIKPTTVLISKTASLWITS